MSIYAPSNRQELAEYCLRSLGQNVIEINIDPDQIEDRIEEAFQFYREFHFNATEQIYLASQVTASVINLQSNNANAFVVGDVITGNTSNSTAIVHSNVSTDGNVIYVKNVKGTFQADEPLFGTKSLTVGQLASTDGVVLGTYDKKYFDIPDNVWSVIKVLPINSTSFGSSGTSAASSMFSVDYQLMLNNTPTLTSIDLGYYTQLKTYLQMLSDTLVGQKPIRFNRHKNRLNVDFDWNRDVTIGDHVVVEAYAVLDPDEFTDVYNDSFLKKYLTALLKRQWGQNLKKFEGVQLPGGVTLNGQIIYQEAIEEIENLKKECQDTYQWPIDFYVG